MEIEIDNLKTELIIKEENCDDDYILPPTEVAVQNDSPSSDIVSQNNNNQREILSVSSISGNASVQVIEIIPDDSITGVPFVNNDIDIIKIQNDLYTPANTSEEPSQKIPRLAPITTDFDIRAILLSHPLGPAILKIFDHKQELSTVCQSYLVQILVLHFIRFDKKLDNKDFDKLAAEIVELFPTECRETYYLPPKTKSMSKSVKSEIAKGKLVDKYRNIRTFIRSADRLGKQYDANTSEEPPQKIRRLASITTDFDIRAILLSHPLGPAILKIFDHKQELSTVCQSYLVQILVLHFIRFDKKLDNKDFDKLAAEIVELFPTECRETYYIPPKTKSMSKCAKSEIAKGKLVDKYRNIRTFIRSADRLGKQYDANASEEPPQKIHRLAPITTDFNIRVILLSHPLGPAILKIFDHKQELSTVCQSYLVQILVLHFIRIDKKLDNKDFDQLAAEIVELFPTECRETYYIPPKKKSMSKSAKSEIAKGKLVDKYRNIRTFIRSADRLGKQYDANTSEEPPQKIRRLAPITTDFDIRAILLSHSLGPAILKIFDHKQELSTVCQSYLVQILVLHFIRIDKKLDNKDFEKLAAEIVELFPTECRETYYLPPKTKSMSKSAKSEIAKGKLVDKYRNIRIFIRSADRLGKQYDANTSEEPPEKRRRLTPITTDFDIRAILLSHPLGPAILKIFDHKQELSTVCQSYLVQILVLHFISIDKKLENKDFGKLAAEIVELFPTECRETYYLPPKTKSMSKSAKSEIAKGKLVDKYRNIRAFIRSADRLGKQYDAPVDGGPIDEAYDEAVRSKNWLVHEREHEGVLRHWDLSFILRVADSKDHIYSDVATIFTKWPILKEAKGYELIDRDFSRKYPNEANKFIFGWDSFFPKLLALNIKKIPKEDDVLIKCLENPELEADGKHAIQFYLLARLVAPKAIKISSQTNDRKKTWKPTIAESREGLVVHVKVAGDIDEIIKRKHSKMKSLGLRVQPFVIIVGNNMTSITKSYVRINEVSYEVPTFLKAIDVVFKTTLMFNLEYPVESENFCYTIQWGLYDIRTESDAGAPLIYNILNKLKHVQ